MYLKYLLFAFTHCLKLTVLNPCVTLCCHLVALMCGELSHVFIIFQFPENDYELRLSNQDRNSSSEHS